MYLVFLAIFYDYLSSMPRYLQIAHRLSLRLRSLAQHLHMLLGFLVSKFFLFFVMLTGIIVGACMYGARGLDVSPLDFEAPYPFPHDALVGCLIPLVFGIQLTNIVMQITLSTELISVDPVNRVIIMDWYPVVTGRAAYLCTHTLVADIYMDP